MPTVTVGTFNVNNLFSRFTFSASIADAKIVTTSERTTYTFDAAAVAQRTYRGKLVKAKPDAERRLLAERIRAMSVDVLALQEVEDIDVLHQFVRDDLGGMYPHLTLIEGNDPRLIDVALVSRLPLGCVSTWKHAVHPDQPSEPVFSRDLLEVEIMDPARRRRLFTVFNTHLKSHYVDFSVPDPEAERRENAKRRRRQAETVAQIVQARTRPGSRCIVLGDMNDAPRAGALRAFGNSGLINALAHAKDVGKIVRADKQGGPGNKVWTHRHKEVGVAASYALYDHIWVCPTLAGRVTGAWIGRRGRLGGDASDHDPAWVGVVC